ncbi:MAG: magnesium transporter, partial [Deltaproteobacteria bacterium]|nr:magnesium transporter [Deltaproteobacteria bacterium]
MAENLLVQRVDAIRRLARRGHAAPLAKVIAKSRAEDLAAVLGHLTAPEQRLVFANVKDDGMAAAVLTSLQGDDLLHIATDLSPDRFVALFEHLAADDQTDLLARLPEELRENILQRMKGEAREEVEELLGYASDTAGGIMSPLAFRLQDEITCRDAIAAVQEAADHELIYYAYVENDDGQLVGVTSLRNL